MNDKEWQALRDKARGIAIDEYTTEASNIIRLTKEDITSIIEVAAVNKEKLSELISIVKDDSKTNNQKAKAIKNITGLVEVAVSLMDKLV